MTMWVTQDQARTLDKGASGAVMIITHAVQGSNACTSNPVHRAPGVKPHLSSSCAPNKLRLQTWSGPASRVLLETSGAAYSKFSAVSVSLYFDRRYNVLCSIVLGDELQHSKHYVSHGPSRCLAGM